MSPNWRRLLDALPDGVILIDQTGVIRHVNETLAAMSGSPTGDLVGRRIETLMPDLRSVARAGASDPFSSAATWRRPDAEQGVLLECRDGTRLHVTVAVALLVVDTKPWTIAAVRNDQEAREAQRAVVEAEQRFRLAFEDNMAPMVFSDLDDLAFAVNDAFCNLVGYSREELLGHDSVQFTHPDDVGITEETHLELLSHTVGQIRYVKRYLRKDGRVVVSEVSRSAARDDEGETLYFVSSERDITAAQALSGQLTHQALHDPLTGLANRTLFEDRLTQARARLTRRGSTCAVLLLDLDDFKGVNDSYGHTFGDLLLSQVARRLGAVTRSVDTLCRFGGDEFLYLAEGLASVDRAVDVAARLLDALAAPFDIEGIVIEQHASIGVSVFNERSPRDGQLVQDADVALNEAKRLHKGRFLMFQPSMHERASERFALIQDLRAALAAGDLRMHYQPVVNLSTGEVVGFESLMRWHHASRGWIPPDVFIPLAEQSDLILDLGSLAIHEAVAAASSWTWPNTDVAPPYVTVNLSAHQFHDAGLLALIEGALATNALPPQRLIIEITEGVALLNAADTARTISRLKRLGVGIALDDFGTGYSSLAYLALWHPQVIKIDRTFVTQSQESSQSLAILETMISLGRKLETTVIAEGIETEAEFETLRDHGCRLGQGFLFSPAMPALEVDELLGRQPRNWWGDELHFQPHLDLVSRDGPA